MTSIEEWADLIQGDLKVLLYGCEMRHAAYKKIVMSLFPVQDRGMQVPLPGQPLVPIPEPSPEKRILSNVYSRACGELENIRKNGWDLRSAVLNNPDFLTREEYLSDVRCLKRRYAAAVERHTQQNLDLSFLEDVKRNMTKSWENRYEQALIGCSTENREELNFIRKGQFSAQTPYLQL